MTDKEDGFVGRPMTLGGDDLEMTADSDGRTRSLAEARDEVGQAVMMTPDEMKEVQRAAEAAYIVLNADGAPMTKVSVVVQRGDGQVEIALSPSGWAGDE